MGFTKYLAFGLLLLIDVQTSAQCPKVHKMFVVNYEYSCVPPCTLPIVDTTVIEYNTDEKQINPPLHEHVPSGYLWEVIDTLSQFNKETSSHFRLLYSDSSIVTLVRTQYKDSVVEVYYTVEDTLYTNTYFPSFKHPRKIIRRQKAFVTIEKLNKGLSGRVKVRRSYFNMSPRPYFKIKSRSRRNYTILTSYEYDEEIKRPSRVTKEKIARDGRLIKEYESFYHGYWKKFFPRLTKYKYDKCGELLSVKTYDLKNFGLEEKTIYFYEYYPQ